MAIGAEVLALIVKLPHGIRNAHNHFSQEATRCGTETRLRISNAQPHRTSRLMLHLVKSLPDPANHSLGGLKLFAVLFKARNPDVYEFVAK
jgi:hypothetical protein